MWSKTNRQISSGRQSEEMQENSGIFKKNSSFLCANYAGMNVLTRPYQLIANPGTAGIQQFPVFFVPGK